jgi:predicted transcriptional regulator
MEIGMVNVVYKNSNKTQALKETANMLFRKYNVQKEKTLSIVRSQEEEKKSSIEEHNEMLGRPLDNPFIESIHQNLKEKIWNDSLKLLTTYFYNIPFREKLDKETISTVHKDIIDALNEMHDYLFETSTSPSNSLPPKNHEPAVNPLKSIDPKGEFIICLEDGQRVKMLGAYIKKNFKMNHEDYIKKWNLPVDYPFTAPNLSKKRSRLLHTIKPWEKIGK